jgi:hypothetical protein
MFPLTIGLYVKFGIIAVALLISAYLGYSYEHNRFMAFKAQVEATARVQEEKVKSIRSQQELVTKGIENEYEAKLSAIRNYYKSTSVWNNPSSSKVPGISAAPSATDVIASYNILAGQCAETTAQTIALQDWLKQQMGIK